MGGAWPASAWAGAQLTQLRVERQDTIVLQFSQEVSRDGIAEALFHKGITASKATRQGERPLALTVEPLLEHGPKARLEWGFKLEEAPKAGEKVTLKLDKWSIQTGFGSFMDQDLQLVLDWPKTTATSRVVFADTEPPVVDLVIALDSHLEIEFSERPSKASLATAVRLSGKPLAVSILPDGFTVRSDRPIPLGQHRLEVDVSLRDLSGRALEKTFETQFEWTGVTEALAIYKQGIHYAEEAKRRAARRSVPRPPSIPQP